MHPTFSAAVLPSGPGGRAAKTSTSALQAPTTAMQRRGLNARTRLAVSSAFAWAAGPSQWNLRMMLQWLQWKQTAVRHANNVVVPMTVVVGWRTMLTTRCAEHSHRATRSSQWKVAAGLQWIPCALPTASTLLATQRCGWSTKQRSRSSKRSSIFKPSALMFAQHFHLAMLSSSFSQRIRVGCLLCQTQMLSLSSRRVVLGHRTCFARALLESARFLGLILGRRALA